MPQNSSLPARTLPRHKQTERNQMSQPDIRYLKPNGGKDLNANNKKLHENYNHVIIDLKKSLSKSQSEVRLEDVSIKVLEDTVKESRRASIKTMEWLNGKVESLRKKFSISVTQEENTNDNHQHQSSVTGNNTTIHRNKSVFEVDGDLMKMCDKFTMSDGNRFTMISYTFDKIVTKFAGLIRNNQIEIHRRGDEAPRAILLLPLSEATGQTLLDFSEMGGYSLGRGSRIVKKAAGSLSRSHCLIYFENNRVFVKDCDSKTGTFVCGKLLGSSIPVLLDNFDIVQLGYGQNCEDSIQFMAIFLSKWSTKEFPSVNTQLNDLQSHMFSRTISVNNLDSIKPPVPERREEVRNVAIAATAASVVNSPKMNEITNKQVEKEKALKDHIVFEIPTVIEPRQESRNQNHIVLQMDHMNLKEESTKSMNSKTSPKDNNILSSSLTVNINPPIPKPRITKRNLSKSIDGLIEIDFDMEVRQDNTTKTNSNPTNTVVTTRVPIETALASRKKSIVPSPTTMIIEIPEFLKLENLKVPQISPVLELLQSIPEKEIREFSILLDERRKGRLQKLRETCEISNKIIVQGGPTSMRYETFIDFGTGTSDISDGLGETVQSSKNESVLWTLNNYRIDWRIEGINKQTGHKTSIQLDENTNSSYSIEVEGKLNLKSKVKIGLIKFKNNKKKKNKKKIEDECEEMNISFKINNETFREVYGKDFEGGVPIEALEQLTYFYPHLEVPSVVIKRLTDTNPQNNSNNKTLMISLQSKHNTQPIGTFIFEKHSINWMKHSLVWAIDVNTDKVRPDSIIHDAIQGAMMLYCLKHYID